MLIASRVLPQLHPCSRGTAWRGRPRFLLALLRLRTGRLLLLIQEVEAASAQPLGGIFGGLGSAIRQLTGHARRDLPAPGALASLRT